jgi:tetratricopeptide (TPR) repeat protein
MDALAKPIRELTEEVKWFMRAHDLRALRIRTTADMRNAVLQVVVDQEANRFNTSPVLVIPDPHKKDDNGWLARTKRLNEAYEAQRERWAEAGHPQPELTGEQESFGARLFQVNQLWRAPARGTIVVLAPTVVEAGESWDAAVELLVRRPDLASVRWVFVDLEHETAAGLRDAALSTECLVDDGALLGDLKDHVALLEAAPAGAPGAAQVGAAWPLGTLPPSRGKHPPMPKAAVAAELEAAGVPRAMAGDSPKQLKLHIMRGAVALREGDIATAITQQRAARDLCSAAGFVEAKLLMQMTLAGYLLHARQPRAAEAEFTAAAEAGKKQEQWLHAAQAMLGLGALHSVAGRWGEAAATYREAAELSEKAEAPILAIEAWRLAGQLALDHGRESEATASWKKAIALADGDRAAAKLSSAPDTARALAAICRRRGLVQQADWLEAKSLEYQDAEASAEAL